MVINLSQILHIPRGPSALRIKGTSETTVARHVTGRHRLEGHAFVICHVLSEKCPLSAAKIEHQTSALMFSAFIQELKKKKNTSQIQLAE